MLDCLLIQALLCLFLPLRRRSLHTVTQITLARMLSHVDIIGHPVHPARYPMREGIDEETARFGRCTRVDDAAGRLWHDHDDRLGGACHSDSYSGSAAHTCSHRLR